MGVGETSHTAAMEIDDLDEVCRLFLRVFRNSHAAPSADLIAYWRSLYFGAPAYSPRNGCVVHRDSTGRIDAAVASFPMEIVACGRILPGRLVAAFMAEGSEEEPHPGGRIGMNFRARTQDFTFSDTAIPITADMSRAGGGVVLIPQSLEWLTVFRPLGHVAAALTRRLPHLERIALTRLVVPFDALLTRILRRRPPSAGALGERPATRAEFLAVAPEMVAHYAIHPRWSPEELGWILDRAAENRQYGPLDLRVYVDRHGDIVGAFAGYVEPDQPAVVLNILARPGREAEVVPAVLAGLAARRCISARGMCLPRQIEEFFRIPRVVFRHRAHTHVLTKHADVREALARGDAYMGGLAGESWSRLVTDRF